MSFPTPLSLFRQHTFLSSTVYWFRKIFGNIIPTHVRSFLGIFPDLKSTNVVLRNCYCSWFAEWSRPLKLWTFYRHRRQETKTLFEAIQKLYYMNRFKLHFLLTKCFWQSELFMESLMLHQKLVNFVFFCGYHFIEVFWMRTCTEEKRQSRRKHHLVLQIRVPGANQCLITEHNVVVFVLGGAKFTWGNYKRPTAGSPIIHSAH